MRRGKALPRALGVLVLACALPAFAGRGQARRGPLPAVAVRQAQAARLEAARTRLRNRLPRESPSPAAAPPDARTPVAHREVPRRAPRPPQRRLVQFILLLLALCQLTPDAEAQAPPWPGPNLTGPYTPAWPLAFAGVPTEPVPLALAHGEADPVAGFERALAEAMDRRAPAPPGRAAEPAPSFGQAFDLALETARPAPSGVAALRGRLQRLRRWTVWARPRLRDPALATQLDRLGSLAQGLDTVAAGQQSGQLDPAVAADLASLAANVLTGIVNAFRVDAQTRTLALYPDVFAQIEARAAEARAPAAGEGEAARIPVPPLSVPRAYEAARKACCDWADLAAQVGIQRVLGASGALNVAAYIVATEAAAELVALDLRTANGTLPAPDREALEAIDLTAATAATLGSLALAPPPGAGGAPPRPWSNVTTGFAPGCDTFACPMPIRDAQAGIAAETLVGSIMNVVGYALYSTSVQLTVALREQGAAPAAGPSASDPAALGDALLRNLGRRALASAPPGSLPSLLAALPEVRPASGLDAEVPFGLDDAACHEAVLGCLARSVRERHLPALAEVARTAGDKEAALAELLADLRQELAAGQRLRQRAAAGTRTAASAALWSLHEDLAASAAYALATVEGHRQGTLAPGTADLLLKDIADTLQALVYALLIETSAVPLEVSLRFQQGALPRLAQAEAKAAGLRPAATPGPVCRSCCARADLDNLVLAQTISREATRAYLAAYVEALIGSSISTVLDLVDLARLDAAATPVPGQGTVVPASVGDAGAAASLAAPACETCGCDTAFSYLQIQLARRNQAGGELTLFTYTLNLVVKGLRVAIAARS